MNYQQEDFVFKAIVSLVVLLMVVMVIGMIYGFNENFKFKKKCEAQGGTVVEYDKCVDSKYMLEVQ